MGKKVKKLVGAVTGGLLGGSTPKPYIPPAPAASPIPAPAASATRPTAGGEVVVGTSAATKDSRVSGRNAGKRTVGSNPLGGLGRGGLAI